MPEVQTSAWLIPWPYATAMVFSVFVAVLALVLGVRATVPVLQWRWRWLRRLGDRLEARRWPGKGAE